MGKTEMKPLAVAVFGYKRPEKLASCLEALFESAFGVTDLKAYIFIDGPKHESELTEVRECRKVAQQFNKFKSQELIFSETNKGLSSSIISGLDYVFESETSVIVIEDDLLVSRGFVPFMKDGLERYESDPRVASIHGYTYPVKENLPDFFFLRGADCWGWATWKEAWATFNPDSSCLIDQLQRSNQVRDFTFSNSYPYMQLLQKQLRGQVDSWAIRWYASTFLKNQLTLYPGVSLVQNVGNDGSGTHSAVSNRFDTAVRQTVAPIPNNLEVKDSSIAREAFTNYFRSSRPSLVERVVNRIRAIGQAHRGLL